MLTKFRFREIEIFAQNRPNLSIFAKIIKLFIFAKISTLSQLPRKFSSFTPYSFFRNKLVEASFFSKICQIIMPSKYSH